MIKLSIKSSGTVDAVEKINKARLDHKNRWFLAEIRITFPDGITTTVWLKSYNTYTQIVRCEDADFNGGGRMDLAIKVWKEHIAGMLHDIHNKLKQIADRIRVNRETCTPLDSVG